jgi:hypothetical protein
VREENAALRVATGLAHAPDVGGGGDGYDDDDDAL